MKDLGFEGITIGFETLSSPREYNFANDSINVKYKLTSEAIKAINTYLKDNKKAFDKYIVERYTSYSGFISHYSNNANVWLNEYLSDKKELSHCFGAVLEFIFENESYAALDLYMDIDSECYLDGWLKEGVGGVNETIETYAIDNYKIKDAFTATCELNNYFENEDMFFDWLTFDYIEKLVNKIFNEIDNKTLNLFTMVK